MPGPPCSIRPSEPGSEHIRGPVDAPLTLVEYSGFECSFCGYATGAVNEVRERFGDEVRYVFRHLPLSDVHPRGELAAEAAEAASAQGAFWAMHDRLFADQDRLEPADLVDHAAALGLELERFTRELGSGLYAARVRDDVASAEVSGVTGTPTFFVNGVRHTAPAATEKLVRALIATDPRGAGDAQPVNTHNNGDPGAIPLILSPPAAMPTVDGDGETPDDFGAFPRLDAEQLATLRRVGRRRRTRPGEVLLRGGSTDLDFVVVLEGTVALVEPGDDHAPRVIAVHGPGRFLGGLNTLAGQRPVLSVVAWEPGSVLVVPIERLRTLLTREPTLADAISRAFLLRRAMLIGRATEYRVIGDRRWPASRELRDLLTAHAIPHQWLDPTDDPAGQYILDELAPNGYRTPIVLAPDGRVLFDPTLEDLTGTPAT